MGEFQYQEIFEHTKDTTNYRKLTSDYVSTTTFEGQEIVKVQSEALTLLAREAMDDVTHLLRSTHLQQLAKILDDSEASANDRFVAIELLKNANISAGRVLPGCQDTGTAIALGYKGQQVFTPGDDAEDLSRGIFEAYDQRNLRYSQMAPLDMYTEKNTGNNLPAQIDLYAKPGSEYHFLFIAKGWRLSKQDLSLSRNQGPAQSQIPARLCRRKNSNIGHLGLPAVSPSVRRGRYVGRVHLENRQAGQLPLSG